MSAENYTTCPACVKIWEEEDAQPLYGTVSEDEYSRIKLERLHGRDRGSLEERYEMGIEFKKGLFRVSYWASCPVCGFSFEFDHNQDLNV